MIKVISYLPVKKGTCIGFITVRLTQIGLEIRDCVIHQKNNSRWIQLPAKPYKQDGETKWNYIIKFYMQDKANQFQQLTLKAFDEYNKVPRR